MASKRKRVKFKATHPEGRTKFAALKKSLRVVKSDFMDKEKRAELDMKKKKEKSERRKREKEAQDRKSDFAAALKEYVN